jgi:hypothetical protein
MAISLDKVEEQAPELVELYKKTKISLDKVELRDHVARVALVLDISLSMSELYRHGKVNELVKKAMALGLQFDDNGGIDVFAFGVKAYEMGEYDMSNYKECVNDTLQAHPLEGGTRYAEALELLAKNYADSDLPVYVMFVTDGDTEAKDKVTSQLIKMSKMPVFLQFMGVGEEILPEAPVAGSAPVGKSAAKKQGFFSKLLGLVVEQDTSASPAKSPRKAVSSGFKYLMELDEMEGRVVDNANFFAIKDPALIEDEALYGLLMNEYPGWLPQAKALRILRK